ncbi:hypothetical protein HK098_000075 [Nowakowskiella sp. JEL0407]|nr:hypothetical protein HK098_000075 [Nowakowskiella sp. JEL0407]
MFQLSMDCWPLPWPLKSKPLVAYPDSNVIHTLHASPRWRFPSLFTALFSICDFIYRYSTFGILVCASSILSFVLRFHVQCRTLLKEHLKTKRAQELRGTTDVDDIKFMSKGANGLLTRILLFAADTVDKIDMLSLSYNFEDELENTGGRVETLKSKSPTKSADLPKLEIDVFEFKRRLNNKVSDASISSRYSLSSQTTVMEPGSANFSAANSPIQYEFDDSDAHLWRRRPSICLSPEPTTPSRNTRLNYRHTWSPSSRRLSVSKVSSGQNDLSLSVSERCELKGKDYDGERVRGDDYVDSDDDIPMFDVTLCELQSPALQLSFKQ